VQTSAAQMTPSPSSLAGLPKMLSQITGSKSIEPSELKSAKYLEYIADPQKALQTINNALLMNSRQQMSELGTCSSLR
jgi:hypothetical protein